MLAALAVHFESHFSQPPLHAASAPGRVNLIGEHTDYNEGLAMPMAIDRRACMLAAPSPDGQWHIWLKDVGDEISIPDSDQLLDDCRDHVRYVAGVIDVMRKKNIDVQPQCLLLSSAVPIGAGLSSSAAIEVATALVLLDCAGITLEPLDTALLCQAAEHAASGVPCGIMDMYASLHAHAGSSLLIDCRAQISEPIEMPSDEEAVLLVADTGVEHELATSAYQTRRDECLQIEKAMGMSLRDATLSDLERAGLDEVLRSRAAHVIMENTRVLLAGKALMERDMATLGDLMFASHESLRDLYDVSCPELDTIVSTAHRLRQECVVFGARMTGGGFGGAAIVLCAPEAATFVMDQLTLAYSIAHDLTLRCIEVRADRAASLEPIP